MLGSALLRGHGGSGEEGGDQKDMERTDLL